MSGDAPDIEVPEPTDEERELQKKQTEILEKQTEILEETFRQQQLIAPIAFKEAGLIPQLNEAGEIQGFEVDPHQEAIRKRKEDIEALGLDRLEKALRGELELPVGLQRDLGKEEERLRETLRKSLGSDFETSTPGIEALSRFGERRDVITDTFRRGELSVADALTEGRELSKFREEINFLNNSAIPLGRNQGSALGFGGAAQGYNSPLSFLQNNRQMKLQGQISEAQTDIAFLQALAGPVGVAAGAIGAAAVGSDRRLKENLRKVLELVPGVWFYLFNYKGDKEPRAGVMADEIISVVPQAVIRGPDGFDYVDYSLVFGG